MVPNLNGINQLLGKLQYVLLALIVYRIGSFIAVPGVNPAEVARILSSPSNLFGLFNTFSGGALSRLSLFTIGIMPYITASIVIQLLSSFEPHFEQLKKEGETGRRRLSFYTRLLTLGVAILQSTGMALFLDRSGVIADQSFIGMSVVVLSFVTGTMVLMWLGEQISEKGFGSGTSLIIFTGIVAGLPAVLGQAMQNLHYGSLGFPTFLFSIALLLGALAFIVFIERAQRKIPVYYARRQLGMNQAPTQQRSDLPLKINMAGVMPTIFASSFILVPSTLSQFFGIGSKNSVMIWLQQNLSSGKPLFMLLYASVIMFFAFYSNAIFFNPKEIAENLKKSGGVIQGVRPGLATAEYIDKIMTRLTVVGSVYITLVALLPELLNYFGTIPFTFGGTSLLIVAVVVMDFFSQVQTNLLSAQYESVLKRYQPKKSKS